MGTSFQPAHAGQANSDVTYSCSRPNLLQIYNAYGTGYHSYNLDQTLTFGPGGTTAGGGGAWYPTPQFAHAGLAGAGGPTVSANAGQAGRVGALSVPQNWANSSPAGHQITATGSIPAQPSATPEKSNAVLGGMPASATGRRTAGYVHKYGLRYKVITRPPSAG